MNIFWALCAVCLGISTFAQPTTYTLHGRVVENGSGLPLSDAAVHSHETESGVMTNSTGQFVLKGLSAGRHHIHVERPGYKAIARHVMIPLTTDSIVEFVLSPTVIELSQVVIEHSISRSELRRQTLDITSIGSDELFKSREVVLAQSLSRLPGVQVIQTGLSVARPVIRGLSGSRILVQDLGMKQEGQQWGSDHGLEIDAYGVGRLEVIKGPGTLQFGPDALGGVLHILPPSVPAPGWRGSVQSTARTGNDLIGTSVMTEANRKGRFFRARMTAQRFGDYRVPASSFTYLNRVLPIEGDRLKNTAGRELHGALTAGLTSTRGTVKWTTSIFSQEGGLFPGIVGIPTLNSLADDGSTRNVGLPGFEVRHIKSAVNAVLRQHHGWIQLDAGVQQNERRERIAPVRMGFATLPEGNESLYLRLRSTQATARWHLAQGEKWKWIPGVMVQAMQHSKGGYDLLLPEFRQWNTGAFLTTEYEPNERSVWTGGIRYDAGRFVSQPDSAGVWTAPMQLERMEERMPRTDRFFGALSAGIGLSLFPSEEVNWKFHLGKSFRPPNPAERVINGVHHGTFRHEMGDSGLRPEHGYQADVSWTFENRRLLIKCAPYFNYFQGYIYLRPAAYFSELPDGGQVYQYTRHNAVFTGADVLAEFHPIDPVHLELGGDYVYSYNLETGLALPFTPPLRLQAQVLFERERENARKGLQSWSVSIREVWVSAQNRTDRNEKITDGYYLTEFSAGGTFKAGNQSLEIRLTCSNLFDVRYMNHLSVYRQLNLPEQGRNVTVVVRIPFELNSYKNQS